jgi:hypothetical protein
MKLSNNVKSVDAEGAVACHLTRSSITNFP